MTSIEAIPQSQKEDLIEFIYMMTLEDKEDTKKRAQRPPRPEALSDLDNKVTLIITEKERKKT